MGGVETEAPASFSLRRLLAERLAAEHLPIMRQIGSLEGDRPETEVTAQFERGLEHWSRHGFGLWVLRNPATDQVIGRAGLEHLNIEGKEEVKLTLGLVLEFRGRGLATDAARACLTIGREWLGLPSVVAITLPGHHACQRVLRKAAFAFERELTYEGTDQFLFRSD
jgi:ribosomal-protein-alanine N-acetyltransferase